MQDGSREHSGAALPVLKLEEDWAGKGPNAVAIGMFDGVHLGHAFLIGRLAQAAKEIGGRAVVLTFDHHPSLVVSPERSLLYITTLEQRVALLKKAGADEIAILPFTPEVAACPPEQFASEILARQLGARLVVVGPNFRFGAGRSGNVQLLRALGRQFGFEIMTVPPVEIDGIMISSTRIRSLISHGHVEEAARLLGRPFELAGEVVPGIGEGRRLGFPTANLKLPDRQLLPGKGVYAGTANIGDETHPAAINVGTRPSIGGGGITVEAYILDFTGDLYGKEIVISFLQRLRDEKKFSSLNALTNQIARDVEEVRRLISGSDG